MEQTIYRAFSDYLKDRYGEKVYKLPIALPVTCPNRDGSCGNGGAGCTFCGEIGTGYENIVPKKEINKARWFDQVTKTTNAIRDVLKISALGIDYKKYALFNFITPTIILTQNPANGKKSYSLLESAAYFESTKSIKQEDCRFCIDFVIDCALKLQEFQFNIKDYSKL